jgi:hypothetical protein
MSRSFGIDTRPTSIRWVDIIRGPSKAEVLAHIAKIHRLAGKGR